MHAEGSDSIGAAFEREIADVSVTRAEADRVEREARARFVQAEIDARMRECEFRIGRAQVIDPAKMNSDKVAFGATVKVLDLDTDEEVVYAIVGEHEADVDQGKISIKSPIARAMIGKTAGDDVTLKLPKGDRELEVVEVVYKAI
ncbi:MAG: transcription elongation factor GreA, partial [Actinomycetota bacterium]